VIAVVLGQALAGGTHVLLLIELFGQVLQGNLLCHRHLPTGQTVVGGVQGQRRHAGMIVVRQRQIGIQGPRPPAALRIVLRMQMMLGEDERAVGKVKLCVQVNR
jgi:hypothetical protein